MMNKLLASAGALALAAGTASAASAEAWAGTAPAAQGFAASGLYIDPLSLSAQGLYIDPLAMAANGLYIDPLKMGANGLYIDPLGLYIDALGLYIDPLGLYIDPLAKLGEKGLYIDPLELTAQGLYIDALTMEESGLYIDPLGLGSKGLWIDALAMDPQGLYIDALSHEARGLYIDALAMDAAGLYIDPLTMDESGLYIDALGMDQLGLYIDALGLYIDPLIMEGQGLYIDPLALDELGLYIDPLAMEGLGLYIDALGKAEERGLYIDALWLWIEALSVGELGLYIDALDAGELDAQLALFSDLGEAAEGLKALGLYIDALSMEERMLWIEALGLDEQGLYIDALGLYIDPLEHIGEIATQLSGLSQALEALGEAYKSYSGMLSAAEDAFGGLVGEATGQSFEEGFLKDFLAKHGLSGNGFTDFLRLEDGERMSFLIDLSDQLTTYLGIDHPDHWMQTVLWSPRIAEVAGYGAKTTVGIVDQGFDGKGGLAEAPESYGPVFEGKNHGRAVSGVVAGAIDNRGVMGVAPEARIVLSNPFMEGGQADIDDVTVSITEVANAGASIVNLSLGETGKTFSQDWIPTFSDDALREATRDVLFVMAAGNDGVAQTENVDFGALDTVEQIMLVGALGVNGEIASFSNTPGDACFITGGACTPMMERFMVAPGEMLLVATEDGVGRASGTSFATPMVAGAAALLQTRWEWLQQHPEATADILFKTATDLGEEGVDSTYGWGLLNVEASQLPIDVNRLFFQTERGAVNINAVGMSQTLMDRIDTSESITAFERVAGTYRDFEVPVGLFEAGAIDPSVGLEQSVERYFAERLGVAAGATQSVSGLGFSGLNGFTDAMDKGSMSLGGGTAGWSLTLSAREPAHGLQVPQGGLAFETHGKLVAEESGLTLSFGAGDGALAFAGDSFAMTSDHAINTGGVNPMLGLASGGQYLHAALPLSQRFSLSGGVTTRAHADLVVNPFSGELTERIAGTEGYRATAASAALGYTITEGTKLSFGLTSLSETDGFLGGQTIGALGFGEPVQSTAMNAGLVSELGFGFTLALDATASRSRSGFGRDSLLGLDGDVLSTAYQAAVTKNGVFGETDRLRFSISQPLHIESGALAVGNVELVDRATGELGFVAETIGFNQGERRYVGEVLYGTQVLSGRGALSLFGQFDSAPVLGPVEPAATTGLRFSVSF